MTILFILKKAQKHLNRSIDVMNEQFIFLLSQFSINNNKFIFKTK